MIFPPKLCKALRFYQISGIRRKKHIKKPTFFLFAKERNFYL